MKENIINTFLDTVLNMIIGFKIRNNKALQKYIKRKSQTIFKSYILVIMKKSL